MILDHFALSHICDNCPVRVKSRASWATSVIHSYTYKQYMVTETRVTLFVRYIPMCCLHQNNNPA